MGFLDLFRRTEERGGSITIGGNTYPIGQMFGNGYGSMFPNTLGSLSASRPHISGDLTALAGVTQGHSVISGAILVRALLMSELWFRWRDTNTHSLFGDAGLSMFEGPSMRADLMQWSQMADLTGQAYIYRDDKRNRLKMMRSDWTRVILGSNADPDAVAEAQANGGSFAHALDAEVVGYIYQPPMHKPQGIPAEFVAHWKPEPHPLTPWLGASWVTSVIKELATDIQVDEHTDKFFEQGATPQLIYTLDKDMSPEDAAATREAIDDAQSGLQNAWRAQYIGGGTDVTVVGSRLSDLGLNELQGKQETRIASRARIPAVVLGISEGMQGSSLNAGNYGQTRRLLADGFYQPQGSGLAAALQTITPKPRNGGGSYLSWDPARVPFLQEDEKVAADIFGMKSRGIRALFDSGFDPDALVNAAINNDLGELLGNHSGLSPVQAQQLDVTPKKEDSDAA